MNEPKVSVLVPVYNGEKFLGECLDSILAQDFQDMEILIADDGSTDGSVALVERYAAKDARIRWWQNERNLGLAANFNCCLRAARGEYIKYVLQDDKLLAPFAIRQMVEALDKNPEVSLVGCVSQVIDLESSVLAERNYFKPGVMDGRQVIMRCLERPANLIGEPSVVLFRRAQAVRGFDGGLTHLVDLEFWFHLLEQGGFAFIAQRLCAFRQHLNQQTQSNRASGVIHEENLQLLERCYSSLGLAKLMTRRMLFEQIYSLRRYPGAQAQALVGKMKRELGRRWFLVFWLRRKVVKPVENLKCWMEKRKYRQIRRAKGVKICRV